jgi:uncharacterized protein
MRFGYPDAWLLLLCRCTVTMAEKTTSTNAPDPRSPLVLDTRELGKRPGSMRQWRRRVPSPDALGTDIIGIAAGAPIDLDLRLESVSEGVLVTGTISATVEGECGRCLDPVSDELVVDVVELFAYPDSTTDATTEEDEVHRVVGTRLDLEPVVRDGIVLGLPSTVLCRADCLGLCPECGLRLDDLPADHAHDTIDPRWAALANMSASTGQNSQE